MRSLVARASGRGRAVLRRVWWRLLIEAKMVLQRLGIPRRGDVLFLCASEWRYPVYLYLSLREHRVIELPRPELPFILTFGSVADFFFRVRGLNRGEPATAREAVLRPGDSAGDAVRRIQLSYDFYESHDAAQDMVTMPYFCHPDFYRLGLDQRARTLRDGSRTIRVLFAGGINDEKYQTGLQFPIMNRTVVLRTATEALGANLRVIRTRDEVREVLAGLSQPALFVLSENTDESTRLHRATPRQYQTLLSRSDFFLAPPGVLMPHCHNIIEAMAVGAIPITNYGAYMSPPLEHDANCIEFETPEDLTAQLHRVLSMPESEIRRMRASVVRYYESHLDPTAFGQVLANRPSGDFTLRVNREIKA